MQEKNQRKHKKKSTTIVAGTSVSHTSQIIGGCGSMYQVEVVSPSFKDLSMVKQHRLVNDALKEEIKGMHGIRLTTKAA